MPNSPSDLMVGEIIEIKYRISKPVADSGATPQLFDRWIAAEIIHQDEDALPMARLADGQLTDIRAYMVWRRLPGARAGSAADAGR